MCEFCDKYGDDDIWYLNPRSYGRQLYRRKLPGEKKFVPEAIAYRKKREEMFNVFLKALNEKDQATIDEYRNKINELYRTNEPCQVIPLQDAYKMVDLSLPVAIMSCICRKVTRATDERTSEDYSCTGLGVGMFKWERWPERYRGGVQFLSGDEAKAWLKKWNDKGMVQTIMVYGESNTGGPFVGGICNCDYPDCIPIRHRVDYGLKYNLLKAHWVAMVDYDECTGCGTCVQRCQFGAIKFEVTTEKTNIDMFKCFGCGVCETGCPTEAIRLERREKFPSLREEW